MGLFDGLDVGVSNEVEQQEERVASGSQGIDKSGIYPMIIKMAYMDQSETKEPTDANKMKMGEAVSVNFSLESEDGKKLSVTEYITSGKKMVNGTVLNQQAYYEKDGKRYDMPGYAKLKNLNYLLNGVHGDPVDVQVKEIPIMDWELKQEIKQQKKVLMDFLNKPIEVCVSRIRKDNHQDTTKFVERSEASHFCDPVTGHFGSEKLAGKEPELRQKFLDSIPEDGIFDKRKNSKNASATSESSGSSASTSAAESF